MRILTMFLAVLGTLDIHAQGILIWSADNWAEHSDAPGASWQIAFDHVSDWDSAPSPSQNAATRILSMTIVTNDTGRTFVANALNEPGFPGFVAGLTDGINGYLRFQDGSAAAWIGQPEQDFFGRSALAPDLAGYTITQIDFRVNNFYDRYFALDDIWFRRLDYSLDFYGSVVPEPSTWALLTLGAAALLMRKKARRHRQFP